MEVLNIQPLCRGLASSQLRILYILDDFEKLSRTGNTGTTSVWELSIIEGSDGFVPSTVRMTIGLFGVAWIKWYTGTDELHALISYLSINISNNARKIVIRKCSTSTKHTRGKTTVVCNLLDHMHSPTITDLNCLYDCNRNYKELRVPLAPIT